MPGPTRPANSPITCVGPRRFTILGPMPAPSASDCVAWATRQLRVLARRAGPGLRRGLGLAAIALRGLGRFAVQHRSALAAIALRGAWWVALLLLVVGGRPVLGLDAVPARELALAPFAIGLALCAAVRLLADPRHLRVGALALGALHATALALVWTAFGG